MVTKQHQELLRRAVQGDARAFELLLTENYMKIYAIAFKWCGSQPDAEDIAHEACIKLAKKITSFKQDSEFGTWLYRITINTAKDYYKKVYRERDKEAAYADENYLEEKPAQEQEQAVADGEIYQMIEKLSPKLKDAVFLVCAEGLSHKEAGQVLKCAEATVSWRVHEAKKKLTAMMGGV
jgi:RNA polymerase sigma-70 factor (ECF subfamily)